MSEALSPREIQILESVSRGSSSKEIGASLRIAETTVNWHISNALLKLAASSRSEAVAIALREGLLGTPPSGTRAGALEAEHLTEEDVERVMRLSVLGLGFGRIVVTTRRRAIDPAR